MIEKLPVNGFKWVKKISKFNERFIKSYNENSDIRYFLKQMQSIQNKYLIFIKIYDFYQREKIDKLKKLVCGIENKEKYVIHIRDVIHIRALKQALNHGLIL